jgi:outer membrane immunogenic protein
MKKIAWVAPVLLALGAAPAFAADLPARTYTKAPPMIAPIYNWGGFYIGANGGGGWAHDCRHDTLVGTDFGCHDASGGVAGGQVGYRWQATNWVFGLEAQGNWADISGSATSLIPGVGISSKIDAFGLFTGQLGYAWNNVLLYAKGGAAVVDQRFDFYDSVLGVTTATTGYDTRWGGTVGAGIEVGFAPGWSVAFEYDHIFLGRQTRDFALVPPPGTITGISSGGDVDLATVRVNYTFGGPIVAKY